MANFAAFGQQFVLKLDGIGHAEMHLSWVATLPANFGSSGSDAVFEGHGGIVPVPPRRKRFEKGNSMALIAHPLG